MCSSIKYLQRSFTGGRADSPSMPDSPISSSHNFLGGSSSTTRTFANKSEQMAASLCANQRLTRSWSQAIGQNIKELSSQEVKRQEVLYKSQL
jgi:hypothetical protein